ncbi:cysteine and histidine-rich domain-containing protein morgana-like [Metopolophium dirhodum]|uniref:cysteine and histidine-rich domain-containing protein morgana-like n=1 Tax=Metopolophium dirhodum TaxID=44670 RepID=UPI00299014AF|nr:cysteine and histidine-rich domain-containing protein morgana-like [Metopolophium dirhodum]
MCDDSNLILCYNRGCAVKFDQANNPEDSCVYHPGDPFFHDAYKGWSCCKKKCTDFTEFLNIKGCTKGYHNGKKPKEPEKYVPDKESKVDVIEYHAPKSVSLPRPSSNLPLINIKPTISSIHLQQMTASAISNTNGNETNSSTDIPIGTMCKNNGCKQAYEGAGKGNLTCDHHPGVPIFHEGMKYWSCCNKKTSDFNAFLEQVGCSQGKHCWIKETKIQGHTNCRLDWHQTGPWVVISIFAKKYDPNTSFVKLSPVKLSVELNFPFDNSVFSKNMELYGIIDVNTSCVSMLPTKVEIKLKKAEAVSWGLLEYRKHTLSNGTKQTLNSGTNDKHENSNGFVESVDLGDL